MTFPILACRKPHDTKNLLNSKWLLSLWDRDLVNWFIDLHLKCYPLPSFPSTLPYPNPLRTVSMKVLPHPPTHSHHPPGHSPKLEHPTPSDPRATPPTAVQQGHPLTHMLPEPWVLPFVFFGSWSRLLELQWFCPVDTVVPPMGIFFLTIWTLHFQECIAYNWIALKGGIRNPLKITHDIAKPIQFSWQTNSKVLLLTITPT